MGSKSVRIPENTYHALKIVAALRGVKFGELIDALLREEAERGKIDLSAGAGDGYFMRIVTPSSSTSADIST